MSFKIPLAVYVVWHPDYSDGQLIANNLYSALCRDSGKPLARSIGIPVYFRFAKQADSEAPIFIDYSESDYVAILFLVSTRFLLDKNYRDYLEKIRSDSESRKNVRLFPVALCEDAYKVNKKLSEINFIRAQTIEQTSDINVLAAQLENIKSCLFHELCRMLLNKPKMNDLENEKDVAPPPIRLFVSHSKHDEFIEEAKNFRKYINCKTQLKTFFDANDIAYGYNFGDEIKRAAGNSALVVFQSDSYADREWCRIEVLTAKAAGCPVVIVNAIEKGERRTFPYLGNYPSIRLKSNYQEIIDLTMEQVLFNIFTKMLLSAQAQLYGVDIDFVISNYPELFTFIELKKKQKSKGTQYNVVIYPDPPLGSEEMNLLNEMDERFYFVTPTMLPLINRPQLTKK